MAVRSRINKTDSQILRVRHSSNMPDRITRNGVNRHAPSRMKKKVINTVPVSTRKRGCPSKQILEDPENNVCKSLPTESVRKRIRPNYQCDNARNCIKRTRGRPRKNSSDESVHLCNNRLPGSFKGHRRFHAHEIHEFQEVIGSKEGEHDQEVNNSIPSEMSEYEMLHNKRKEELLLMLRKLFAVDATLQSPEKISVTINSSRPRKHSKRPLPPVRPRSLRLQGLPPGRRTSLRRRQFVNPPPCLCCLMSQSSQSHR